ncbi:MAG: exopolyphosphatase [Gammaproteobacteria bacterium]|nr:exopolyphosphatase [Gammaproteobacteria bacterium]MDH5629693.1 exopolyphosphatase [Gammaproteobacteria bacterium]
MTDQKYRLITRSDFDGLVCAVLLKHLDMVDEIKFVHPKDMQDGKIEVTNRDISTNLPYVAGVHLAFDHHLSETLRNEEQENHIIDPNAPSAARVVWDHYGGHRSFPEKWDEMMEAVDRGDSAQFNRDQILNPEGWDLLNFLMDARTGLGRFREFRISNYNLMMELIDHCKDKGIEEIMQLEDVQERVDLYRQQFPLFKEQLDRCTRVHDRLMVIDLREEEVIHAGNRFVIYALNPDCNVSIHVMWGFQKQNTVFATGKSIFNKSSQVNIGELMLEYGGGGHGAAGTCQVEHDRSEQVLQALIKKINNPSDSESLKQATS